MDVLSIDFTTAGPHPRTFSEAIEKAAGPLGDGDGHHQIGLIRPWNFLVIDAKHGISNNIDFYQSFFGSVNVPKMILVIDDSHEDDSNHLVLPLLFEQHQQRLRIISMRSLTGCVWDIRSVQPEGICSWQDDHTGAANLSALSEAISIPEVYEAIFSATADLGAGVWSAGTKQAWFGSIEPRALSDAFNEVGLELLGDDTRFAELKPLKPWVKDVGEELLGSEYEDDILAVDGAAQKWFHEITSCIKNAESVFGLKSWRRGALKRVAGFPNKQVGALDRVAESMLKCDVQVRSLLENIDPSDGFQKNEHTRLRRAGVNVQRQDSIREERYRGSDIKMLETALSKMDFALEKDYSLSSVQSELEELISLVTPRTKDEILRGKKSEEIDEAVNNSGGFEEVSLKELQETILRSARGAPKNPFVYIGRWSARLFQNSTIRVVGSFLYLWLLLVFLFETLELSDQIPSLVPTPASAREIGRLVMTVVFAVISLIVIFMGLCISYAAQKIFRWGFGSGILRIDDAAVKNSDFFKKVVLNDWVLWSFRNQASRYLKALDKSIQNLEVVVRESFVHMEQFVSVDSQRDLPNPLVRQIGGDLASAAWFKQIEPIKKMLKTELVTLVRHRYRTGTPEFRTERCDQIAEDLANDLRQPFLDYITRLQHDGVLHVEMGMSAQEIEIREKLASQYWGDFEELRISLMKVVEIDRLDPIVQFIRSEDIMRIDQGLERTVVVPFAPEPSRRLMIDSKRGTSEIVFTQSTELAGVIRLAPFRYEQFSYVTTDSEG